MTSTSPAQLSEEAETFSKFLKVASSRIPRVTPAANTSLLLASSAGGVYAGVGAPPYAEESAVVAASAYGETKLAMERALTEFVTDTGCRAVIARISNLYGPDQRIEKPQGLVSQLCKSLLRRRPISIYVSLDTMRDYIYSDDAAMIAEACLARIETSEFAGLTIVKNVASHEPTTLGHLLHEARLVFKRKPTVILASSPLAAGQVVDLRVESTTWPEMNDLPRRSLMVGMSQVKASMELQMQTRGLEFT